MRKGTPKNGAFLRARYSIERSPLDNARSGRFLPWYRQVVTCLSLALWELQSVVLNAGTFAYNWRIDQYTNQILHIPDTFACVPSLDGVILFEPVRHIQQRYLHYLRSVCIIAIDWDRTFSVMRNSVCRNIPHGCASYFYQLNRNFGITRYINGIRYSFQ